MRPTVEDLQAIWLFTYAHYSLLNAANFIAELDKAAPRAALSIAAGLAGQVSTISRASAT